MGECSFTFITANKLSLAELLWIQPMRAAYENDQQIRSFRPLLGVWRFRNLIGRNKSHNWIKKKSTTSGSEDNRTMWCPYHAEIN